MKNNREKTLKLKDDATRLKTVQRKMLGTQQQIDALVQRIEALENKENN